MKAKYILQISVVILTSCSSRPKYDATGIFEATTVTVSAETTGKLISLSAEEGDTLSAGSMIALVDTTTLALQRMQIVSEQQAAEATSPDISAQVASLRTQIAHWQNEVARQERLLVDGATTQKHLDDAQAQLNTLKGQLTAQLSTLGKNRNSISQNAVALQYRMEQVEDQIKKSSITSPISGTVLLKYTQPGEFVTPGKPLLKIANLKDVYLRSYFTTSQLADLKIGQKVTVIADFGGVEQFEYPGIISWIAQESEFTPKSIQTNDSRANLVYAVKIAVRNDGRIKLGQYGEVRL